MQKITPFLWFDKEAEEAANFYVSVFKDGKITDDSARYTKEASEVAGVPEGTVLTVAFELFGLGFIALNGGPGHATSDAVSFVVDCEDQSEIDEYWEKLTANGGEEVACGWLKDKYGFSWQIVPKNLSQLIGNPGGMAAMLKMKKLVIADLEAAKSG